MKFPADVPAVIHAWVKVTENSICTGVECIYVTPGAHRHAYVLLKLKYIRLFVSLDRLCNCLKNFALHLVALGHKSSKNLLLNVCLH